MSDRELGKKMIEEGDLLSFLEAYRENIEVDPKSRPILTFFKLHSFEILCQIWRS